MRLCVTCTRPPLSTGKGLPHPSSPPVCVMRFEEGDTEEGENGVREGKRASDIQREQEGEREKVASGDGCHAKL